MRSAPNQAIPMEKSAAKQACRPIILMAKLNPHFSGDRQSRDDTGQQHTCQVDGSEHLNGAIQRDFEVNPHQHRGVQAKPSLRTEPSTTTSAACGGG